ncbi:MAG: hypothetical protein ACM33T_10490 [Solirubrobacterales bacterium]
MFTGRDTIEGGPVYDQAMAHMGWAMGWAMAAAVAFWLLVLAALILGIAALVKYLRTPKTRE